MYHQLIEHVGEQLYSSLSSYDHLNQKAIAFLVQKKFKSVSIDFEPSSLGDPFQRWIYWRMLLKSILLESFQGTLGNTTEKLKEKWYELCENRAFSGFQLEALYAKITAHYLKINDNLPFEVSQRKSGLCLLFTQDYWRLLKVPFIDHHAEFGSLLIILGKLKDEAGLINQGYKAALWHMKNLDNNFMPYRGFLSNHFNCDYSNIVLKQAALFHGASLAIEDREMAYLAKTHLSFLLNTQAYQLKDISLETLLLWNLVDKLFHRQLTPISPELPNEIFEEDLPVVGCRNENISALCSFLGSNTSMGSLKFEDLELAAFGPQLGNLGEGANFGFIDLYDKPQSYQIKKSAESFSLKGLVGLPKIEKKIPRLLSWQHAVSWLDTKLVYEKESLTIQIKPLRLTQNAYFVFYVIADQCLIKGEKRMLYQSLEQFQGKSCSVSFLTKNKMMALNPSKFEGEMKIIPLEGEQSFWGANYLIAYHLNNKYSTFEWEITSSNR